MKTIAIVYGTRPEAIKLAPVIVELKKLNEVKLLIICSGQHKELLDGIMGMWDLVPDILIENFSEARATTKVASLMKDLENVFLDEPPDMVVVQGDTATATAAALQAHYLGIPIAHVEAGLRSHDLWNPWPEESNRRIIDSISSIHFAPTLSSARNLESEGHSASTLITGNTVVDALNYASSLLDSHPEYRLELEKLLGFSLKEDFILFTQHRREAFGEGQTQLFEAVIALAEKGNRIVFPVHLNPAVRNNAMKLLDNRNGIYLIPPQKYLPFIELIRMCKIIISDSGGLQEEAPTFGKRILITRLTTERPEVIESGYGQLVGYNKQKICSLVSNQSLNLPDTQLQKNPFGTGKSAEIIANSIFHFFEN